MDCTAMIIDGDKSVRRLLCHALRSQDMKVYEADSGLLALREIDKVRPDICLLETQLPDMEGLELIEKLRASDVPMIVVSERCEILDRVGALDAGADDFLAKPVSTEELLARIRAVLRRGAARPPREETEPVFENGNLRLDFSSGCVYVDGSEIHLTPIEYRLLCLLARNVGKVLPHGYILENVWQNPRDADQQSLRVYMASLRKKLESGPDSPKLLQTQTGVGYRLLRYAPEETRGFPYVNFIKF